MGDQTGDNEMNISIPFCVSYYLIKKPVNRRIFLVYWFSRFLMTRAIWCSLQFLSPLSWGDEMNSWYNLQLPHSQLKIWKIRRIYLLWVKLLGVSLKHPLKSGFFFLETTFTISNVWALKLQISIGLHEWYKK